MTDDEIIKKAGAKWSRTRGTMDSYLKLVIQYAREDEREACIKALEGNEQFYCRDTIRARGEPAQDDALEDAWNQAIK